MAREIFSVLVFLKNGCLKKLLKRARWIFFSFVLKRRFWFVKS
jgi:hypothetical protein